MIEIENSIIGQMFLYPDAHNFIMKLNPQWFSSFRKDVVTTMQEFYISNEPVSLASIGLRHREHIREIATMQNVVTTNVNLEREILKLEITYKKNAIQRKMSEFNYERELQDIISDINLILQENTVSVGQKAKVISSVAGTVIDTLYQAVQRGTNMTGISTGWKYLDKYIGGWNKGNMVVIAGRPGSGKTAIALSFAIDSCRLAKVLFISLEMSKEELAKRYLSFIANVENYKIRSARLTESDLKQITEQLYGMNMDFFLDDGSNSDINDIVAKIKLHKAKHGLDIVFIDYMQLIKSHQKIREQEIAHISRTLKLLAKELGITIIALAQLSRETEKRAEKKPMLSDLRESGQIEQDADIVLFPFRPAYYSDDKPEIEMDAELIIGKNRHGQCVSVPMSFEGRYTRYKEIL
jgi:replicative DNA helicase